jgi:hypothetical protein
MPTDSMKIEMSPMDTVSIGLFLCDRRCLQVIWSILVGQKNSACLLSSFTLLAEIVGARLSLYNRRPDACDRPRQIRTSLHLACRGFAEGTPADERKSGPLWR